MSEVVFIGTSDAFGACGRRQSAILARGSSGTLLLDCGVTTNTGLGALGIARDEIDVIAVSHFHGDHFGGIPLMLLAALYEDRRTRPLQIAGPPDLETRVRALASAMGHRLDDQDWTFPFEFHELRAGQRTQLGPVELQSFETKHQIEAHPHGYRANLGDQTIAYTGDTGWFDELPRLTAEADLLISECTFPEPGLDFHLSLAELVEHRDEFDVGHLVATHLGTEMAKLRGQCELETADDGMVVKL